MYQNWWLVETAADVAVPACRNVLLRDCMMLIIPTLCHGWMAITSYRTLTAPDQKPESTVPDDQKKAPTPKQPTGRTPTAASAAPRKKTEAEEEDEEPQATQTATTYDPYQAYYANYYGSYPGYGYGGYGTYAGYPGYGYGYGSWRILSQEKRKTLLVSCYKTLNPLKGNGPLYSNRMLFNFALISWKASLHYILHQFMIQKPGV